MQQECRCSNDLVSDARVSARRVFIADEIHGRESVPFAQLSVSAERSTAPTLALTSAGNDLCQNQTSIIPRLG